MNEKPPISLSKDNEKASVTDLRTRKQIQRDNFNAKKEAIEEQGYIPEGRLVAEACLLTLKAFGNILNEKEIPHECKLEAWNDFRKEVFVAVEQTARKYPFMDMKEIFEEIAPDLTIRLEVLCAEAIRKQDTTVVSLNAFRNQRNRK